MKSIIFFPFTRMSKDQARAMDMFFNGVKILTLNPDGFSDPAVARILETGQLTPVFVGDEKISLLEDKVRSFREWADVHRGNEKNLKTLIRENAYFRDETDVTAIQSGIRRGMAPSPDSGQDERGETDPLLVLRFAEILDQENEAIQNELEALEQNNSALFAELKGEAFPSASSSGPDLRPDPGADRTGERVSAWCAAARNAGIFDGTKGECPVIATTSPAVLDYLRASSGEVINGLDIDSIKVHEHGCDRREIRQTEFYHTLDEFIFGKDPLCTIGPDEEGDCSCPTGELKLIRFPDGTLNEEFNIPGTQVVVCLVKLNS